MFKIVQEKGLSTLDNPQKIPELITVPNSWHVGLSGKVGKLYWPRKLKLKKIEYLRKTNAHPQLDCEIRPCILKRTGFQTFEAAEGVRLIMQDETDQGTTDNDNHIKAASSSNIRVPRKKFRNITKTNTRFKGETLFDTSDISSRFTSSIDNIRNEFRFAAAKNDGSEIQTYKIKKFRFQDESSLDNSLSLDEEIPIEPDELDYEADDSMLGEIEEIPEEDISTNEIIENLVNNQNMLVKQQKEIIHKQNQMKTDIKKILDVVLSLNTKLEKLVSGSLPHQNVPPSIPETVIHHMEDMKKVDNKNICHKMEEQLMKSVEYRNAWIKQLSSIYGTSGNHLGNGYNCCFNILYAIFDKHFLTECSWTGGTRTENKPKINFSSLENIISLIYEVVLLVDKNFTREDLKKFIKLRLRNASQACASIGVRQSAGKKRPKKLIYGRQKKIKGEDASISNYDSDNVVGI